MRDGLKSVQRRILDAMHEMNLRPTSAYRKSAAIMSVDELTAMLRQVGRRRRSAQSRSAA